MPTGELPTGVRPTGAGAPGGGFGGFSRPVSGTVSAVSGSTFTVAVDENGTKTDSTVTVTSDTTYTATVAAKSSALEVGQCATAVGTADDSGAVAATTITLSKATDQGCSVRRGGRQGGFGGAGGQAPGAGSTDTTNG
ncbi:hypothetical protein D1871_14210 [Nakamurella silvestris]|nr:hypothetical protein D1871_14210 [Nakamurella silvestris]